MKTVLFVDDDLPFLQSLQRVTQTWGTDYLLFFAQDASKGVEILKRESVDIVITDINMPQINGLQLLNFVARKFPEVIRIAMSGESNADELLLTYKITHRFMKKPMSIKEIKENIDRVFHLQELVPNSAARKIIAGLTTVPSLSNTYFELLEEVQSQDSSLQKVAFLISQDASMAAAILKIVNSSFFGLKNSVSSLKQAVTLLGLDIIKALVLSVELFKAFTVEDEKNFSINMIMERCLICANFTQTILHAEKADRELMDITFMTALLHDVGQLIFASEFPQKYRGIIETSKLYDRPLWELEKEALGTTHAEAGAYLLGLWGLPDELVEAIAFHHTPSLATKKSLPILATLHVADLFSYEFVAEFNIGGTEDLDHKFLKMIEGEERWQEWHKICRERLVTIGYISEAEETIEISF